MLELWTRQSFGDDVSNVVLSRHVRKIKLAFFEFKTKKMLTNVEMFDAAMMDRILAQLNGRLIVSRQIDGFVHWFLQLLEKIACVECIR